MGHYKPVGGVKTPFDPSGTPKTGAIETKNKGDKKKRKKVSASSLYMGCCTGLDTVNSSEKNATQKRNRRKKYRGGEKEGNWNDVRMNFVPHVAHGAPRNQDWQIPETPLWSS